MSRQPRSRSARLALEALEDRTTPTFLPRPGPQFLNVNGLNVPATGLSIAAGDLLPDPGAPLGLVQNEYVTGTGPGVEGLVRVWRLNGLSNGQPAPALTLDPFPGFRGGINVAVGDVLGDGEMEIIAAVAGNGPPNVKVFSNTGQLLSSFMAFDGAFLGGVNVAVGNVLGGIGAGGYAGGAVSSDFKQEIILGAAAGNTPQVAVTDGSGTVLRSFLAFDLAYRGGVTVAAANLDTTRTKAFPVSGSDTNAYDEIIVGAATNSPHVKAFDVWTGAIDERLSFFAFDPARPGGVTVAAGSTDGFAGAEIYVSQITPANSTVAPNVHVYNGDAQLLVDFVPYPPGYSHVLNMVVAYLTPRSRGLSVYNPSDDDTSPLNRNPDFLTQDLAIVAGDGPYFQEPRFLIGLPGAPAGANGPPP
jgi:hypothetical protein